MKEESKFSGPVIGMCGRSGSGKSTVCAELERYGVRSIDTDKVYRDLIAPNAEGDPAPLLKRIAERFGADVILADGSLDRRALAGRVFGEGNEERLALLNSITHTAILEETERIAERYFAEGAVGVVVDAPALFESGFHEKCDAVVCVTSPEDVSVRRIMDRDGISEEAARLRLSSQISAAELSRRCDLTVINGGEGDPEAAAFEIFERLIKK